MHTELVLLANAYIEVKCLTPWLPALQKRWIIVRTVDYSKVCLQ